MIAPTAATAAQALANARVADANASVAELVRFRRHARAFFWAGLAIGVALGAIALVELELEHRRRRRRVPVLYFYADRPPELVEPVAFPQAPAEG